MPVAPSHWKLLGGVPCLDFANSRSRSPSEGLFDFFWDYSALLQWSLQLGLLTQPEAETLLERAGRQEIETQAALQRTRDLREALYAAFSAAASGQSVPAGDLAAINAAWTEAMDHLQVSADEGGFRWNWVGTGQALDSMLWPLAKSAAELLVSENLRRVKRCGGCGWLFLDLTRDARRRWCDMKICGNRAKARRHYDRKRAPSEIGLP